MYNNQQFQSNTRRHPLSIHHEPGHSTANGTIRLCPIFSMWPNFRQLRPQPPSLVGFSRQIFPVSIDNPHGTWNASSVGPAETIDKDPDLLPLSVLRACQTKSPTNSRVWVASRSRQYFLHPSLYLGPLLLLNPPRYHRRYVVEHTVTRLKAAAKGSHDLVSLEKRAFESVPQLVAVYAVFRT